MMGRRKSFKSAPKLWQRKNGRLCRCNLADQLEYPSAKTISSLVKSVSSHPHCWKKFSVLDLPVECLVIVLKNLPFYEICNVARVCKRFYQVTWNPTLWKLKSIDLSSVYNFPMSFVNLGCLSQCMTFQKRRMLFASFLSARGAALTDVQGEVNICREADMFCCLLNCNVRNLQTVKLRLPYGLNYLRYMPGERDLQAFRHALRCLVQKCSNFLKSFKCYVDISYTTAKLLGSLHALEYLNLQFLPPPWPPGSHEEYLQPKAIDAILSLPNLKYFKISICQSTFEDRDQPEYVLKSDSLETLDFGHTKNFIIKKLILPKLHTIKAECLHNFHDKQRAVCLFDIVEDGCPQIQTLNDFTSFVPGLQNFNLSNEQKIGCYFCICPIHDPSRSYN